MKAKDDDLRPEYPAELIKKGVRGKYAKRYREGTKSCSSILICTNGFQTRRRSIVRFASTSLRKTARQPSHALDAPRRAK